MANIPHQKHADMARPALGQFHRHEWAILGSPCSVIQHLARELMAQLSDYAHVAYVDADHQQAHGESSTRLASGASIELTDKIQFNRIDRIGERTLFQQRTWLNEADLVLVNGNHFPANRQIVIIDPRKEASLQKRLTQLSQVDLILLTDSQQPPFDFLQAHLATQQKAPKVLALSDVEHIADYLRTLLQAARPALLGLVLAGGKSQRMGQDKGTIAYHGQPQREYAAELLRPYCTEVFLSVRPDQAPSVDSAFPLLPDTFLGLGPMGAILSAFQARPDAAWLVIACDLPLLQHHTLEQLVRERHTQHMATAFISPVNQFPEPLIAIWEPRSYPILLQFLAQGISCPRKALINNPVHLLHADNPDTLQNINYPEEMESLLSQLHSNRTPEG